MSRRSAYRWTRDLHLYLGLFISPMILVFALSVISLNHAWLPWGSVDGTASSPASHPITVMEGAGNLELARDIQRQIGIAGEIDFINHNEETGTFTFPITAPGYRATIRVDLGAGLASIDETRTGVWDAMNYLHKMPGPHNVSVRGNWVGTRVWSVTADWTVYLLLFVSASGVYLWTAVRAERRAGLLFLGGGALSFVAIILALVG